MGAAAHAIGNTELEDLFAKSLDMLERPNTVVFNPSYVLFTPFTFILKFFLLMIPDCIYRIIYCFIIRFLDLVNICRSINQQLHVLLHYTGKQERRGETRFRYETRFILRTPL